MSAVQTGASVARLQDSWRLTWLTLVVHVDAFRFAPLLYLQGVAWRARRLRVRSRNRFAALMGRSPHAYALWIKRHEAIDRRSATEDAPVQPLVDCRHGMAGARDTIADLEQFDHIAKPIQIGGERLPGIRQARDIRELADLLDAPEPWLLPIRAGDRLADGAFSAYAKAAKQTRSCLVYADDDLIDLEGKRHSPHFKPDWNPELFDHHDFIAGSCIVRCDRNTLRELPAGEWDRALVQTAVLSGGAPVHLKQVLHHRRTRPEPSLPALAKRDPLPSPPSVSAIIPTRNRHDLLKICIDGLRRTGYAGLETIVVDNGTDDPRSLDYLKQLSDEGVTIIRIDGPFNYSALNNAAVKRATGDLLCFLNNDVEMIDADWLAALVSHAIKTDLGAVGARLLYPDRTIQHAGVVTGIGGGAGHAHRYQPMNESGYFSRASLPQRVSAVTAACMVVAREKFLSVGGFDEQRFPVAFNDVDLCLKLNARGWQSFYEPRATLIHHESKSRGSDRSKMKRARFEAELAALKDVWQTDKLRDPYHHPNLSPFCEQFVIAV